MLLLYDHALKVAHEAHRYVEEPLTTDLVATLLLAAIQAKHQRNAYQYKANDHQRGDFGVPEEESPNGRNNSGKLQNQ